MIDDVKELCDGNDELLDMVESCAECFDDVEELRDGVIEQVNMRIQELNIFKAKLKLLKQGP